MRRYDILLVSATVLLLYPFRSLKFGKQENIIAEGGTQGVVYRI